MSTEYSIRLLTNDEMPQTIPLVQLLNLDLKTDLLLARQKEMCANGYQCIGVFADQELIGCCGFWVLHKYYVGKHIEPDNVIIRPEYRSLGVGKKMMDWLEKHAKTIGCEALELNAYVTNHAAQKFWMNEGHRIIGFHFQKKLQ